MLHGEAGSTLSSSSGMPAPANPLLKRTNTLAAVLVRAGGSPGDWRRPAVRQSVRRLAEQGVRIGGISGGPYLLAEAGLLKGRCFTSHWKHAPALVEAFPDLRPEQARLVIDGARVTCGGGVAPLDLMHALIVERMGAAFARRVADCFLRTRVEPGTGPQRAPLAERVSVHYPTVLTAFEKWRGRSMRRFRATPWRA